MVGQDKHKKQRISRPCGILLQDAYRIIETGDRKCLQEMPTLVANILKKHIAISKVQKP